MADIDCEGCELERNMKLKYKSQRDALLATLKDVLEKHSKPQPPNAALYARIKAEAVVAEMEELIESED